MLDLTFEEEGAELEFREELVLRSRPTELRLRLCGVLSLTLHCQQLARAGGGGGGSAAVALVGFLTGAFLLAFAWRQTGQSLRCAGGGGGGPVTWGAQPRISGRQGAQHRGPAQ